MPSTPAKPYDGLNKGWPGNKVEPSARRGILLDEMKRLNQQNIHCGNCRGDCCTSKSNSMKITREEAVEIVVGLKAAGEMTPDLMQRLERCIEDYRLNVEIPRAGGRSNLRRTYTCPFFHPGANGCKLTVSTKPLGCLAFNPVEPKVTGLDGRCASNIKNLAAQEKLNGTYGEKKAETLPIPVAVRKLMLNL